MAKRLTGGKANGKWSRVTKQKMWAKILVSLLQYKEYGGGALAAVGYIRVWELLLLLALHPYVPPTDHKPPPACLASISSSN